MGRQWIAEGCRVLVSWGALKSDAAKTCPELLSFWRRCWAEEFPLWVLLLELDSKRDPKSDNQSAGSTCKSTSDGETDRKHHMALSIPKEKMLTPALNASRADSSKMDQGHCSEGQGKGGRARRSVSTPLLVPRHHF